ncbi:TPA: GIY-YIG nuclease family protein [Candidatus Bipolaricaulota bacterium]|nr:GIY-YIG nuclease family protein [Candidatus Bipolaricaulota bacterium]
MKAFLQPCGLERAGSEGQKGDKGIYALILHLVCREEITIGRLGKFTFPAGYYLYLGSALGPGGLEARLTRHLREGKRPHWHIDYLLERARVIEVWTLPSAERLECLWARAARELPGARLPVLGFGSSDCSCPSHLIHLIERPSFALFVERMQNIRMAPRRLKTSRERGGVSPLKVEIRLALNPPLPRELHHLLGEIEPHGMDARASEE